MNSFLIGLELTSCHHRVSELNNSGKFLYDEDFIYISKLKPPLYSIVNSTTGNYPLSTFHFNGYTSGFHLHKQKLEPPYSITGKYCSIAFN